MTLTVALDALESEWRRLGVAADSVLAPGLPPQDIEARLLSEVGAAPSELIEWFAWHNGTMARRILAPIMYPLLTLDASLQDRRQRISLLADEPDFPQWGDRWVPITESPSSALFAYDAGSGEVLAIDYWSPGQFDTVVAAGLSAAIESWTDMLRCGYYSWTDETWHYDYPSFPPEAIRSGLFR